MGELIQNVRPPHAAGALFPADGRELSRLVRSLLARAARTRRAPDTHALRSPPKAIIAPHADYACSGSVAAAAYATLAPLHDRVERVVVLGPVHDRCFSGIATSGATAFASPVGVLEVDRDAVDIVDGLPHATRDDDIHDGEHAIEAQIPFLVATLGRPRIVPILVGRRATREEIEATLDELWGGDETVVVVSSDLSASHDYATARWMDEATSRAIESLDAGLVGDGDACAAAAIRGLLDAARRRGMRVATVDLRSSGDALGERRDDVVGYGAYALA